MITNLLFDLGGVIMDLKRTDCEEAFRRLGMKDPSVFFNDYVQRGPFKKIEGGEIGPEEFHAELRAMLPAPVTDEEIDSAFMRFLVGIPVHRLRLLQQLRHKYGVYLLSNTNPIMWSAKIAQEFSKDGLCIDAYFDGVVTSFQAKALKPDPAIFRYAVERLGISPEQTLFIDDSEANLEAAAALGFRTAHVPHGKDVEQVIGELNLL